MRLLLLTALFASGSVLATERTLAFTIAGPTVEPGAHELLLTETPHFGRPEPFLQLDTSLGIALGITSRLEAQVLLAVSIDEFGTGAGSRSAQGTLATRWRWQVLDGHRDWLGVGLIGTVAVGPDLVFLEARLGAEKWLGDFLFALNASVDYSVRKDGAAGPGTHLEQSGGIVYRLANGFTSGFELRNRLGLEGGDYYGDAIYVGPVFALRRPSFWLSVAALAQVAAVKASALYGNGEPLELRDNERWVLRFQLGFEVP
jgi:hypothetical protein